MTAHQPLPGPQVFLGTSAGCAAADGTLGAHCLGPEQPTRWPQLPALDLRFTFDSTSCWLDLADLIALEPVTAYDAELLTSTHPGSYRDPQLTVDVLPLLAAAGLSQPAQDAVRALCEEHLSCGCGRPHLHELLADLRTWIEELHDTLGSSATLLTTATHVEHHTVDQQADPGLAPEAPVFADPIASEVAYGLSVPMLLPAVPVRCWQVQHRPGTLVMQVNAARDERVGARLEMSWMPSPEHQQLALGVAGDSDAPGTDLRLLRRVPYRHALLLATHLEALLDTPTRRGPIAAAPLSELLNDTAALLLAPAEVQDTVLRLLPSHVALEDLVAAAAAALVTGPAPRTDHPS